MHTIRPIAALILALTSLAAAAAGPFDLDIGTATQEQVEAQVGKLARQTSSTTNKWTGGAQITYAGQGLGIDQLLSAAFIFDADRVLVGAVLELPKSRYDAIQAYLDEKYDLVQSAGSKVSDRRATFRDNGLTIIESGPRAGFRMTVSYIGAALSAAYRAGQAQSTTDHKARETAQF